MATWEGGREQNAEEEKSQLSPAPPVISWLKQAGANVHMHTYMCTRIAL